MSYEVKPMQREELAKKIKEKADVAIKNGDVKILMHNKQPYEFPRIKLRKDWLYYNLQNDRTLTKTREFIEENDKEKEYFDKDKIFNYGQQKDYHNIIKTFIPLGKENNMPKVFSATNDQRDPLYVTYSGVMANGNTRLSCFREYDLFDEIECLLFPEDYSGDWGFIRQFVDKQDNAQDIKTEYPWYARAERIEKNIIEMKKNNPDLSENEIFEDLYKKMQYQSKKEIKLNYEMLKLARKFIDRGYKKFKKLSDLEDIGVGEGAGIQVFTTLATVKRTYESKGIPLNVKERKLNDSFEVIASGNTGEMSSRHLAIQALWAKNNVDLAIKKLVELDGDTPLNPLGGDKIPDDEKSEKYESDPYLGQSEKDRTKTLDKELNQAATVKEATTANTMRGAFKNRWTQTNSKLDSLIEHSLKIDSDLNGIDEVLNKTISLVEEAKARIRSLKRN